MEKYAQIAQNNNRYDYPPFIRQRFEWQPPKKTNSSKFWLWFILAIIAVIWLSNRDNSSDVDTDANLSPYPVYNGKIIIDPDYECVCPLEVKAESDINCYVRLVYLGEPNSDVRRRTLPPYSVSHESDIAFYVETGKAVKVDVPIGIYKFYYATGNIFYGVKELFGKNTSSFTSDENLYFYVDGNICSGGSITLRKVPHGNFSTYSVNRNSFPTD